ncbi:hypothetical protein ABZ646_02865 [Streptomyces sp. NPDC007162]|uniref:hypothetical protein n=1 Tax=Streptomyces sp. NPDC007162 TaxID=3156917 RepID=UPI0033E55599
MSATHSAPARGRRLLAAAVLVLVAASTLTGCRDGQGVRDEGPSAASLVHPGAPTGTAHSGRTGTRARWSADTGSRPRSHPAELAAPPHP